jgi:KTSC domain
MSSDRLPTVKMQSSMIREVQYIPTQQKLLVTFHTMASYIYQDVSMEEYEEVLSAPSQGKAFNAKIKKVKRYQEV